MAVRAVPERPPPVATAEQVLPLSAEGAPARAARRLAERQATRLGPDLVEAAGLVASELVTNSVLHSPGVVAMRVGSASGGLLLSVEDLSPVVPRLHRHSLRAATGRGLQLADAYAAEWGSERCGTGKRMWVLLTPDSVAHAQAAGDGDRGVADLSAWESW